MARRAPKSFWSASELCVLRYLLLIYGHRNIDYRKAARLFENRTAAEIKKRCICIRDLDRRKTRQALEAQALKGRPGTESSASDTDADADVDSLDGGEATPLLPPEGQLHPEVVWVPTTAWDIGYMTL